MSVGSVTMARAMPTRCCSPPESVRGVCFARCVEADDLQRGRDVLLALRARRGA